VEHALDALQAADLVSSRSLAAPGAPWVARRWAGIEAATARAGSAVWSQQLAVRADTFRRVGGFDAALATGEDADFSRRVRESGGTVRLDDRLVAVHHGFPADLGAFVRRERWHTSTPGWFRRMSWPSRAVVLAAAAWVPGGAIATVAALVVHSPVPAVSWGLATIVALASLGLMAGSSARDALPDGLLVGLWAGTRASRLARGLERSAA
jgi:hypothetical protein